MEKVGIITLGGYWNYGNRLQNLALKKAIEKYCGKECVTIKHWQHKENISFPVRIKKIVKRFVKPDSKLFDSRVRKFKDFSAEYLEEVEFDSSSVKSLVVGSDQVWNPLAMSPEQYAFFFLSEFRNVKKVSYAASIAVPSLKNEYAEIMREESKKFDSVSVREEEGSRLMLDVTGIKPEVVLDPTMLLEKTEWMDSLGIELQETKKIFKYVLGENIKEVEELTRKLCYEYGLSVEEYHSLAGGQKHNYDKSPIDFVRDIANARLVVTDSFHAAVFAIIFNTPFIIAERVDEVKMSSRIDTLLRMTGLEERRLENIKNINKIFDVDFTDAEKSINKMKKSSLKFLTNAI